MPLLSFLGALWEHCLRCALCLLTKNKAAAAAAKSLQSCLTLCNPIDGSPSGFPIPGILQARTLEWVAISFSNAWKWKVKVKSLSRVPLLPTPWTAAYQAFLSMGFPRQEYWSGVPSPSPKNKASGGDWIPVELFQILRWCCESAALSMSANLENTAVATGLEKVSFHSNPKERQCQRKFKVWHNCTHLTY